MLDEYYSSVTHPSLALFTNLMYFASVPRVALEEGCFHAALRLSNSAEPTPTSMVMGSPSDMRTV